MYFVFVVVIDSEECEDAYSELLSLYDAKKQQSIPLRTDSAGVWIPCFNTAQCTHSLIYTISMHVIHTHANTQFRLTVFPLIRGGQWQTAARQSISSPQENGNWRAVHLLLSSRGHRGDEITESHSAEVTFKAHFVHSSIMIAADQTDGQRERIKVRLGCKC